jgi:hypothetical protein
MTKNYFKIMMVLALMPWTMTGCSGDSNTVDDEIAQQVGDTIASVDEAGSSSGTLAYQKAFEKTLHRLAPAELKKPFWSSDLLVDSAYGFSCLDTSSWKTCTDNVRIHHLEDCMLGNASLTGTVTLTWGGPTSTDCKLQGIGDTIARDPKFKGTGLRGATLEVSKTGTVGHLLTLKSINPDKFDLTTDGIRRVFTRANGNIMFDFTNTTTSAITVTGATRANRVLNGGVLDVKNNLSGVSCDLTPTDVKWDRDDCNCAVSGSWSGKCSDGKSKTIAITGCGTATIQTGNDIHTRDDVIFDRCDKI